MMPFTLPFAKNYNNAIAVGKAVNALMKVIHEIEGDSNKFKISPWKSKQPNLEVLINQRWKILQSRSWEIRICRQRGTIQRRKKISQY